MKCRKCKGCMRGILVENKRLHYCSLCTTLYEILPGFKLEVISSNVDEIVNILGEEKSALLKIE